MRSDVLDLKTKTTLKPTALTFGEVPHAPLSVLAGSVLSAVASLNLV